MPDDLGQFSPNIANDFIQTADLVDPAMSTESLPLLSTHSNVNSSVSAKDPLLVPEMR
jgi:hypothetical protein